MAKFIIPKIESVKVRVLSYSNFPVNINLVTGVEKTTKHTSNGHWFVDEPIIKFYGIDITWHFGEHGLKERDACFDDIMKDFSQKTTDNQ